MKRIILAFAVTALAFGACTTKPTPVTVALSSTSTNQIGLKANTKQVSLTVSNSTAQAATINWERAESTPVSGWTYTVNGGSAASGTLSIPANSSATVTLAINPNNIVGTGVGTLKFYDAADQTATMKTFTYNYSSVTSYFTISPVGQMADTVRMNAADKDYHIWVINNNTVPVDVVWKRTLETANPSAWTVVVCTDLVCWDPTIYSKEMTLAPGDSVDFKATVGHFATVGVGGTTALFYVASDSLASHVTQTIDHTVEP